MSTIEKAVKKAEVSQKPKTDKGTKNNEVDSEELVPDAKIDDVGNPEIKADGSDLSGNANTIQIDWDKLAQNGFLTPNENHSKLAEEYRIIKRPLVINALSGGSGGKNVENPNLILITSSLPGEGKTFSALNLALSITHERDKKVLLIDADVAKPSIAKLLGISPSPGLVDYLEGSVEDFSETIQETDMPGFRVVPAGKQHQYSTELLASNKMMQLTRELSKRYSDRIVIFDSPPLLVTTQADILTGLVGQVVLVIEAEVTSQDIVKRATEKLANCQKVMLMLNKSKTAFELNYYGYGRYGK